MSLLCGPRCLSIGRFLTVQHLACKNASDNLM